MDVQLKVNWPDALNEIAQRLNPHHEQMLAPFRVDFYCSAYQSE